MKVNLIKGDRVQDADYRDALPVNMYTVIRKVRDSDGYLINQPGISNFATTSGVDRGGFYSSRFNGHFRVTGLDFISIDANGNVTTIGNISGSDQVNFTESFNNICIIADEKVWYYNPTDGLVEQVGAGFAGTIDGEFLNGVFLFTDGDNLYHTTLADETVINADDFATSEISPDPTKSVARTPQNQAMVFDRFTISYFIFDGGDNFAFSVAQGKSTDIGIVGTQCQTNINETFFILGGSRDDSLTLYQVSGTSKRKIATREIEKVLATYTEEELQNASLEVRGEDGYQFVHVNLPNDTLLFNYTVFQSLGAEFAWSILKTSVTSTDGWLGINGIRDPRVKKWLYGDRFSARVGQLDNTISTLYGENVECLFYSPFVGVEDQSIDSIEIKTISGFTPEDATVAISLTYDGQAYGKEWFNLYGQPNQRAYRFIARRLGYVRDFVGFKFRAVTPSRLAFGALELNEDD
jgi:hypothetical protein